MTACGESRRLQADNRIGELARLAEAVNDFLLRSGAHEDMRFTVQLALEELFVNIVHYAYTDSDRHRIDLELRCDPDAWVLSLEDDGRPFDPAAVPVPDIALPLERRPVGGLGLFLVRQLCSRIDFERTGDRNRVTVFFAQPPAGEHGRSGP